MWLTLTVMSTFMSYCSCVCSGLGKPFICGKWHFTFFFFFLTELCLSFACISIITKVFKNPVTSISTERYPVSLYIYLIYLLKKQHYCQLVKNLIISIILISLCLIIWGKSHSRHLNTSLIAVASLDWPLSGNISWKIIADSFSHFCSVGWISCFY